MSTIIGLVQLNNRVGRTTLTTTVAAGLATFGPDAPNTVTIIDCDVESHTASMWCQLHGDNRVRAVTASNVEELRAAIKDAKTTSDFVIIDGPRRNAQLTAAIAHEADITLVPMRTCPPNAKKEAAVIQLVERFADPTKWRIVWNQSTPGLSYLHLAEVRTKPALTSSLSNRASYTAALMDGKAGYENNDPIATHECTSLISEISDLIDSPMAWAAETLRL